MDEKIDLNVLREVTDEDGGKSVCININGEYREHGYRIASVDYWRRLFSLPILEDDIFIITYPRVGTTLLQTILLSLFSKSFAAKEFFKSSPFIELITDTYDGPEVTRNTQSPRLLKTHLPMSLIPKTYMTSKPKSIIVVRNYYDCLVSNYNFYLTNPNLMRFYKDLTLDQFFDIFVKQELHANGSWFKWHKEWLKYATSEDNDHCLVVNYKDLVEDKLSTIKHIAKFLDINVSEELLYKAKEDSDFNTMQERFSNFGVKKFIREGQIGRGKEQLSEEQRQLFDEKVRNELGELLNLIKM